MSYRTSHLIRYFATYWLKIYFERTNWILYLSKIRANLKYRSMKGKDHSREFGRVNTSDQSCSYSYFARNKKQSNI